MKITLLTVGKTDRDWVRQGLDIYVSRLKHYIPFILTEIPELKNVSALSKDQIKIKEGELILKNIRPADDVILLDEHGKEYSSVQLAKILQDKISYECKDIVFVIGGAYGFSDAVYARANSKLSLSKMTFSHQMVRTIFAEQLYRAFTIMKGEPYHHE
ncbi:MAG: 23S rRNA (pseudouridine(1915)-N(3))-methyltransferase RlmH [Bacteroidales bacterium]|nr:23S rRNA (pseudouridine(1915)-N(3))-methyltransferase RlmH [Bacteroidales bacterium]